MGRGRKKGHIINGWINFDKPYDMTSTDAVYLVRKTLNARKAGHAGTLDPLATGILPIALGEATKMVPYCQDQLKSYRFTVTWGEDRDTNDAEGDVIGTSDNRPEKDDILNLLERFTGYIQQTPPRFSAIKVDGKRAYDLARNGEDVDLSPREVYIETIALIENDKDTATFECLCGKGTYVRSIARDMAEIMDTCGYISALRRASVGGFDEGNAISVEQLQEMGKLAQSEAFDGDLGTNLLPLQQAVTAMPVIAVNQNEVARLKNGQALSFISRPDYERLQKCGIEDSNAPATAIAVYNDKAIAVVSVDGPDVMPSRVFNL